MIPLNTFWALRDATRKARASTGDPHIATQVANGQVDVVRAVPPATVGGRYTIAVLHAGLTPPAAVAYLESMVAA